MSCRDKIRLGLMLMSYASRWFADSLVMATSMMDTATAIEN